MSHELSPVMLIDGDGILYSATAPIKQLDDEGKIVGYKEPTMGEVFKKAEQTIEYILSPFDTNLYIGIIGGKQKNFRYGIYSEYKANRANREKPKFLEELRNFLITQFGFIESQYFETDDLIRTFNSRLDNAIIASSDKDLLKLKGIHFNIKSGEIIHSTGDEADKFFWQSMIVGDAADNVKGIPRKGKVFAERNLSDDLPYSEQVFKMYIKHFGADLGAKEFAKNFNVLYIRDDVPISTPEPSKLETNFERKWFGN